MTTGVMTVEPGMTGADYVKMTDSIRAALIGRNVKFVCRYSVPPETTRLGKAIEADEVRWLHDHGIGVLLNWEINERDGDRGTAGGKRAGEWLKARAAELGCPTAVPLFCSIDTDTNRANVAAAADYCRAFAAAIAPHPFGLYSDADMAHAVKELNPVFWRANATGWGAERADQPAHVQQHLPSAPGWDLNTARRPFPAWVAATTPPPEPEPPTEVPDMIAIRPKNPLLGGGKALFTVDGHPLSPEVKQAANPTVVDQDHRWWDAATLERLGSDARRMYAELGA